jgi:hypothetical protein
MNYLEWNELIVKRFFNEENSGREVLLYVNEKLINELSESCGAKADDFINAVKEGPPWATRRGFCQKALQTYENWRDRNLDYPPYVAYLAFFVLAAGTEGPFAPYAYYPRLWKLLQDTDNWGQPPSFDRMIELWDDLEKWSSEDKREELGRFVRRIRGGWWKVGLPLSQTLLSEEERKHLPNLFAEADLDSTDTPSPDIVPRILQVYGQDILERRTLRFLDSKKPEDIILKEALVALVLDELEEWDGAILKESAERGRQVSQVQASLRICLHIDNVSQTISSYLRFKTSRIFPEEGLNFGEKANTHVWSCKEICQGWSTKLIDYQTSPPTVFDSSRIDWNKGLELIDNENHWRAKLKGVTTRLFVPGKREGLPDFIETQRLERRTEFIIACQGDDIEKVRHWGADSCEIFEERSYEGLPSGWIIFYGKNATKSCDDIDILSVSASMRLLLRGGIKTGSGNIYLKYAPPKVILENSPGDEQVTMNGIALNKLGEAPVWELPDDSPTNETLHIEVKTKDYRLHRIIRLEEPELPLSFSEIPCRDNNGMICEKKGMAPSACGAFVDTGDEGVKRPYPQKLPVHLSHRILFIGERPGEIADWPRESLPSEWNPVWALAKKGRKKWEACFCGIPEKSGGEYFPEDPVSKKAKVKRWKEALWIRRKTIIKPRLKHTLRAWMNYLEAAKHV